MIGLAAALSLGLFVIKELWPSLAWISWPLLWLATLFHELGHGLAALALGGELEMLAVYLDGSGVAVHRGAYTAMDRALIAAAGPLGAPLGGLALFLSMGHRLVARVALFGLGMLLVLTLVLWVRNLFGLVLFGTSAAIMLLIALRAGERLLYLCTAFIAVEMSLSAFARLDYLFSPGAATGAGNLASDSAQISAALGLPYWLWGGLLAAAACAIVVAGFFHALRLGSQRRSDS
jgi:hypothetical protein